MADYPDNPDQADKHNNGKSGTGVEGARRTILRSLVLTGGIGAGSSLIPATWTRPVIEAVTLPAHAQTTVLGFNGTGAVGEIGPGSSGGPSFESFVQNVREAVVRDAQALEPILPPPFGFCVNIVVANLNDPDSPATVTVTSNFFGTDVGNGTLSELRNAGISTTEGYLVIAEPLPGGGGSGTIDAVPFVLAPGPCSPQDAHGESIF